MRQNFQIKRLIILTAIDGNKEEAFTEWFSNIRFQHQAWRNGWRWSGINRISESIVAGNQGIKTNEAPQRLKINFSEKYFEGAQISE